MHLVAVYSRACNKSDKRGHIDMHIDEPAFEVQSRKGTESGLHAHNSNHFLVYVHIEAPKNLGYI